MKKLIFSLIFAFIALFSTGQTVNQEFAGWANVTSVSGLTITINSFQGNPKRFDDTYVLADLQIGDVLWAGNCSRFIVSGISGLNITVTDPDAGSSVLPVNGERIGFTRETGVNGFAQASIPQFGDGNAGAVGGTTNSLGACIMAHYEKLRQQAILAADEITPYAGGAGVAPAVTAVGKTGQNWQNGAGEIYYSNGSAWLLPSPPSDSCRIWHTQAGLVVNGRYQWNKNSLTFVAVTDTAQIDFYFVNRLVSGTTFEILKKGCTGQTALVDTSYYAVQGSATVSIARNCRLVGTVKDGIFSYFPETICSLNGGSSGGGTVVAGYGITGDGASGTPLKADTTSANGLATIYDVSRTWQLAGNNNATDAASFVGTTNAIPLNFRVNNIASGRIHHTDGNTIFGYNSALVTTATNNTRIGYETMRNATGTQNTGLGMHAGFGMTSGTQNTMLGYRAGFSNTTGTGNIAIGYQSGFASTTSSNKIAIGNQAAQNGATVGGIAIGYQAMFSATGSGIAIGNSALSSNTGSQNIAIGVQASQLGTSGSQNIAIGDNALNGNLVGINNILIGYTAGDLITSSGSTGIGSAALTSSTTGVNTGVGLNALSNITTGTRNVAVGESAGVNNFQTTQSDNVFIGALSGNSSLDTYSNSVRIGKSTLADKNNQVTLGGDLTSEVRFTNDKNIRFNTATNAVTGDQWTFDGTDFKLKGVQEAFLTGSTTTTLDLDAGATVDVDGAAFSFTGLVDAKRLKIIFNGLELSRSGTIVRDYTFVPATGVVTFVVPLIVTDKLKFIYE